MYRSKLPLLILICCQLSYAQTDTSGFLGTIKIIKHKDSTSIKAYTDFVVYNTSPNNRYLSYGDYVRSTSNSQFLKNSVRYKITEAKPVNNSDTAFDYTNYFKNNQNTKNIALRPEEADTVCFFVSIDTKGNVKFYDFTSYGKIGNDTVINNASKSEYKKDLTHYKTKKALKELTYDNWKPALIQELKTHPSKRKNKYFSYNGYTEGLLIVLYSSTPFKE